MLVTRREFLSYLMKVPAVAALAKLPILEVTQLTETPKPEEKRLTSWKLDAPKDYYREDVPAQDYHGVINATDHVPDIQVSNALITISYSRSCVDTASSSDAGVSMTSLLTTYPIIDIVFRGSPGIYGILHGYMGREVPLEFPIYDDGASFVCQAELTDFGISTTEEDGVAEYTLSFFGKYVFVRSEGGVDQWEPESLHRWVFTGRKPLRVGPASSAGSRIRSCL